MNVIDRKTYIGSSDARDILNTNWHALWLLKTGRREPDDLSDQFNVQLGIFTEGFHLDWAIRRMVEAKEILEEMPLSEYRQFGASPRDATYILAHIDAIVKLEGGLCAPVEAKHSSGRRSIEELTDFYMPQLQHQMWCTRTNRIVLSVIQGNTEPERVWVGRSEEYLKIYAAACAKFWQYVKNDTAPVGITPEAHLITPKITDAIPINGRIRRDVSTDNAFMARANDLIENEAGWRTYEGAKKDLKAMMGPEDGELYSPVLSLKKDARGAVRFTIAEKRERTG